MQMGITRSNPMDTSASSSDITAAAAFAAARLASASSGGSGGAGHAMSRRATAAKPAPPNFLADLPAPGTLAAQASPNPPNAAMTIGMTPSQSFAVAAGGGGGGGGGGSSDVWSQLQMAQMSMHQQMQQQMAATAEKAANDEHQRIDGEYKKVISELEHRLQLAQSQYQNIQTVLMSEMNKAKEHRQAQIDQVQKKLASFFPRGASTLAPTPPAAAVATPPSLASSGPSPLGTLSSLSPSLNNDPIGLLLASASASNNNHHSSANAPFSLTLPAPSFSASSPLSAVSAAILICATI